MRLRGIAQVDVLEVVFARTLNRDLEIVRDVRDISYQRTIVFNQRRLFDLPAQEGVAGHHLFDDDLTVLALAGFRARCACCAPCASLHCRHSHTPPSISPFPRARSCARQICPKDTRTHDQIRTLVRWRVRPEN